LSLRNPGLCQYEVHRRSVAQSGGTADWLLSLLFSSLLLPGEMPARLAIKGEGLPLSCLALFLLYHFLCLLPDH
jgi:hypothetical protein